MKLRALKKFSKLGPIVDCKTRWSSMAQMITRFNKIWKPLKQASIDLEYKFDFSESELFLLQDLEKYFALLSETVNTLSKTDCNLVTSDLAVSEIILKLDQESLLSSSSEVSPTRKIAKRLSENIRKRY